VRSYPEPNKTFADLRAMVNEHAFDPLRSFSESCREELERLKKNGSLCIVGPSGGLWLYNPRRASLRHGFEQSVEVQDIRLVAGTIPTLAWSARPDGPADFFNQHWLDYRSLSAEQALDVGWKLRFILMTCREFLRYSEKL
jgi:hypothetical protein